MATPADVERLLRSIPLANASDESHAVDLLQNFLAVRGAVFEGMVPGGVPGFGAALSIPAVIQNMRNGNFADAAIAVVGMAGDAAGAYAWLVEAASQMGTFSASARGALWVSATQAGMFAEAAGPGAMAVQVLLETFRIPGSTAANLRKLYFATDAGGIFASWLFNMPDINPHARLSRRARVRGPWGLDLSDTCRQAHDRVHHLWRSTYQGKPQACQEARAAAGNSWEQCWRDVGAGLGARLGAAPRGACAAWIDNEIIEANRRLQAQARAGAARSAAARQRQAAGGYHFRTPEGVELFMPDP